MSSTPDNGDVTAVDAARQEFRAALRAMSDFDLELDAYFALKVAPFSTPKQREAAARKLEEGWPKLDILMDALSAKCKAYGEAEKAAAKAARKKAE
jgi:hypothetical protein